MRIIDDIINKEVVDNEAKVLGRVTDIEFDTSTNKLESLIVVDRGGFNKDKLELHVPFEQVSRIGDKIMLRNPLEDAIII